MSRLTVSCLIYASLLSLTESAIFIVGGTLWSGQFSIAYLRITAFYFVVIAMVGILSKAPALAGILILMRKNPRLRFRWAISILNVATYGALILLILIPALIFGSSVRLPEGYLLYGAVCLLAPQIPWLGAPKLLLQKSDLVVATDEAALGERMNRRLLILPATLILIALIGLFSTMTSVCSTSI